MSAWDYNLKTEIAKINANITTVERLYGRNSSVYRRIVSTISKAGGGTRFSIKMFDGDFRQKAKARNALESVKASKYLTKKGRAEIGEKARATFKSNMLNKAYDSRAIEDMFDVFQNSSLYKLIEIYGSSSEIVDAITSSIEKDDKVTTDEIEGKIRYLLNNDVLDNLSKEDALEVVTQWLKT